MGEALVADSSISFQINGGSFGYADNAELESSHQTADQNPEQPLERQPIVQPWGQAWAGHAADADEKALIRQLCDGCEAAYEILIDRFERPVFNLVARLTDEPADAADVVQEVFLKVFRNVESFRGDCSLKTWVYRIAVNEARNHRRWFSRHRRQEVGIDSSADDTQSAIDWMADPGQSPLQVAMEHESQAILEKALGEVNPSYRAALVLREIEGMSYDEIAQILEISLGTVKSRIVRGREDLRGRLTRQVNAPVAHPGRAGWSPKEVTE